LRLVAYHAARPPGPTHAAIERRAISSEIDRAPSPSRAATTAAPQPPPGLRYARAVQVFLVRHADAIAETLALRDPHRHLTALGRQQARALGDRLRWHDCVPTHVWSSPLVRAIQTAELVTVGLESALVVAAVPALAPEDNPRAVTAALAALAADSVVVVVGHEPALSAIGALLVHQREFASLAKAQAARIVDGVLRWRFACDADAPEVMTR
jgi:phosphohistidine phosphatase